MVVVAAVAEGAVFGHFESASNFTHAVFAPSQRILSHASSIGSRDGNAGLSVGPLHISATTFPFPSVQIFVGPRG